MQNFLNMIVDLVAPRQTHPAFAAATPKFSWPTFIGGVVSALLATWVF